MDNELYHYGVLGMKWGVRKSRAPSSRTGRKTRKKKWSFLSKKSKKQKTKNNTPAKKEMTVEEKKDLIIKSQSAKTLYQNRDLFSDDELRQTYQRLMLEKNLRDLSSSEKSRGAQYVDSFIKFTDTANKVVGGGITFYKNAESVKKILSDKSKQGQQR